MGKIQEVNKEAKEEKNIEDIGVGKKKEVDFLKPTKVKIEGFEKVMRQENECLVLICKHPDAEAPIKISGIKMKRFDKLKVSGLWLSLDEEGQIPYFSGVGELLRMAEVGNIKELVGKEILTDVQSSGTPLLVVKGY